MNWYSTVFEEFKLAKQNLENAKNNFNNASAEYFDIANQELTLSAGAADESQAKEALIKRFGKAIHVERGELRLETGIFWWKIDKKCRNFVIYVDVLNFSCWEFYKFD